MSAKHTATPNEIAAAYAVSRKCRATYIGGGWIRVQVIDASAPYGCTTKLRVTEARAALAESQPQAVDPRFAAAHYGHDLIAT